MTAHRGVRLGLALALFAPTIAMAQGDTTGGARSLHIGSTLPPRDTTRAIPDSVLRAALARFNAPNGLRFFGDARVPAGEQVRGSVQANGGRIRLEGTVDGDVVVINGDLLVASSARIAGSVTVLGGSLTVEPGAQVGPRVWWREFAPVARASDNTLVYRARNKTLSELASSNVSFQFGPVVASIDGGLGQYNRVEGMPIRGSARFSVRQDAHTTARLDLSGILRTASDPAGVRPNIGWFGRLSVIRSGEGERFVAGVAARQVVAPMADQAFTPIESALSTLIFHEDYRDWFTRRGWGLFADWRVAPHATLHGSFDDDQEESTRSADPFSLFRNNEAWRPNPLIDNGKFRRLSLGAEIDTRNDSVRANSGWWIRLAVHRITSSDLSPLSLPTSIRSAVPFTDYASQSMDLDARRYLQMGPGASLHLRVLARGLLSGDPLLMQDRLSMGGGEILPGYHFRDVNCDLRRTPDPAKPALCDRQMDLQVEYHRTLNLSLATRIGRFAIGLDHPSLVLFGNAGTAWLSGDSAGRVPSNRIQSLAEWRSDVGIGIDNRWIAAYLSKSLADHGSPRLILRIRPRF